jgi:hypothetical protein
MPSSLMFIAVLVIAEMGVVVEAILQLTTMNMTLYDELVKSPLAQVETVYTNYAGISVSYHLSLHSSLYSSYLDLDRNYHHPITALYLE